MFTYGSQLTKLNLGTLRKSPAPVGAEICAMRPKNVRNVKSMSELVTGSQMREVEAAAMAAGTSGLDLMERAGAGVVEEMIRHWPVEKPGISNPTTASGGRHVLVLCGPGNNGGDGYVVARLLRDMGYQVHVAAFGDPERLKGDARTNWQRWHGGVAEFSTSSMLGAAQAAATSGQKHLPIVDALFGIGQRAPLDDVTEVVQEVFREMKEVGVLPWTVAVDIPTGLDTDSGALLCRQPIMPQLVVTFHALKPVHLMPQLADAERAVVDIGL